MPTVTLVIDVDGMITQYTGKEFEERFAPESFTKGMTAPLIEAHLIKTLRHGKMKDLLLPGVVETLEALLDEEFSRSIGANVKVIFNSNNYKGFIKQLLLSGGLSPETLDKLSIYGNIENAGLPGENPKIARFGEVIGKEPGDKNFVMDDHEGTARACAFHAIFQKAHTVKITTKPGKYQWDPEGLTELVRKTMSEPAWTSTQDSSLLDSAPDIKEKGVEEFKFKLTKPQRASSKKSTAQKRADPVRFFGPPADTMQSPEAALRAHSVPVSQAQSPAALRASSTPVSQAQAPSEKSQAEKQGTSFCRCC